MLSFLLIFLCILVINIFVLLFHYQDHRAGSPKSLPSLALQQGSLLYVVVLAGRSYGAKSSPIGTVFATCALVSDSCNNHHTLPSSAYASAVFQYLALLRNEHTALLLSARLHFQDRTASSLPLVVLDSYAKRYVARPSHWTKLKRITDTFLQLRLFVS